MTDIETLRQRVKEAEAALEEARTELEEAKRAKALQTATLSVGYPYRRLSDGRWQYFDRRWWPSTHTDDDIRALAKLLPENQKPAPQTGWGPGQVPPTYIIAPPGWSDCRVHDGKLEWLSQGDKTWHTEHLGSGHWARCAKDALTPAARELYFKVARMVEYHIEGVRP